MKQLRIAIQVAFTYIGTVVGAGFASGQEILQFFTAFGHRGYLIIFVTTVLFIWFGTRMMMLGHRLNASSYHQCNTYLFGLGMGRWVNGFIALVLFGVTTAMLSGTGSLFQERLDLSFHIGVGITIVLAYIVIVRGMEGILSVNSIVVPLMIFFSVIIGIHGLLGLRSGTMTPITGISGTWFDWIRTAIVYVAFNLAMAQAVLVPLGKEVADESVIKRGGLIGGIGLGVMLWISHFALSQYGSAIFNYDIPMAEIISALGFWVTLLFVTVMWAEIFTTLIGNVYGLTGQIQSLLPWNRKQTIGAILLLSYGFSLVGFSTLITYVYPAFGICGIILLAMIMYKRLPRI